MALGRMDGDDTLDELFLGDKCRRGWLALTPQSADGLRHRYTCIVAQGTDILVGWPRAQIYFYDGLRHRYTCMVAQGTDIHV